MAKDDDDLDADLDKEGTEDDENEKDDDEGKGEKGDGDGDWTPPTKAEWEAKMAALKKSRSEVRTLRRGDPPKGKTGEKGKDDAADPEAVRAEAETAAAAKWKPTVVRTAARAALVEAGLVLPKKNGDATMSRVLRMLDMDDIEINDDGDIEGLEDQIAEIKADCPDLFAEPQRRRTTRLDASGRSSGGGPKKTSADLIAAQLMGG